MEIEKMREIIDLMIEKGVQGFEVGDFKVSFWSQGIPAITGLNEDGERIPERQRLDMDLGIDEEDI